MPTLPFSLFLLVDFLGVFTGALGGGLEAMRDKDYQYDFVGVLGLAMVSALGGGITRDILLQKGPPLAFQDVRYLMTALIAALLALMFRGHIGPRTQRMILWIDASAIGFFAVAGSTRALDGGLTVLPALILGLMTAVGGGALRDVISGRTPKIFQSGQLYAVAALLGSAAFLTCNSAGLPRTTATTVGLIVGFSVRALALQYNLRTRAVRADSGGRFPSGF
ncbi:MAG TPA: TRIC cation channel family protein [Terriglobales bacterium]